MVHFLGANGAAKLVAAVIAAMVALTIGAGPSFTVTTTELAGADCGVDSAGAPARVNAISIRVCDQLTRCEPGFRMRIHVGAAKVGQHAKIWRETAKGRLSTAFAWFEQR